MMQDATIAAIDRLLATDTDMTPAQRAAVLSACKAKLRHLGTKQEAAAILGVHPESVKRYAQRGLLHPIRITARRVRYDLDEARHLADYGSDDQPAVSQEERWMKKLVSGLEATQRRSEAMGKCNFRLIFGPRVTPCMCGLKETG